MQRLSIKLHMHHLQRSTPERSGQHARAGGSLRTVHRRLAAARCPQANPVVPATHAPRCHPQTQLQRHHPALEGLPMSVTHPTPPLGRPGRARAHQYRLPAAAGAAQRRVWAVQPASAVAARGRRVGQRRAQEALGGQRAGAQAARRALHPAHRGRHAPQVHVRAIDQLHLRAAHGAGLARARYRPAATRRKIFAGAQQALLWRARCVGAAVHAAMPAVNNQGSAAG